MSQAMDSNPTMFIVTKLIGGYAREDAPGVSVVGCFTDEDVARKVALATSGKVAPVALNTLSAGLIASLAQLGLCLLYTSPSPRDKRQSRMPSSA